MSPPWPARWPSPHAPEAAPTRAIPTEPPAAVGGVERLLVEGGNKVLVDGGSLCLLTKPLGLGFETGLFEGRFLGRSSEFARHVREGVVVAHCVVCKEDRSGSGGGECRSGGWRAVMGAETLTHAPDIKCMRPIFIFTNQSSLQPPHDPMGGALQIQMQLMPPHAGAVVWVDRTRSLDTGVKDTPKE